MRVDYRILTAVPRAARSQIRVQVLLWTLESLIGMSIRQPLRSRFRSSPLVDRRVSRSLHDAGSSHAIVECISSTYYLVPGL
jgi:hypothetical protein